MTISMDRRLNRLETQTGAVGVDVAAIIEAGRVRARSMTDAEWRDRQTQRLDTLLSAGCDRRLTHMETLIMEGTQRDLASEATQ